MYSEAIVLSPLVLNEHLEEYKIYSCLVEMIWYIS